MNLLEFFEEFFLCLTIQILLLFSLHTLLHHRIHFVLVYTLLLKLKMLLVCLLKASQLLLQGTVQLLLCLEVLNVGVIVIHLLNEIALSLVIFYLFLGLIPCDSFHVALFQLLVLIEVAFLFIEFLLEFRLVEALLLFLHIVAHFVLHGLVVMPQGHSVF